VIRNFKLMRIYFFILNDLSEMNQRMDWMSKVRYLSIIRNKTVVNMHLMKKQICSKKHQICLKKALKSIICYKTNNK